MTLSHATPFAGSWYPKDHVELESLIDDIFHSSMERTGPFLLPRPLAFVVPHAGLRYSGTVAAAAYRHLRAAAPGRVFILGFTHRAGRPGVLIPDIGSFQTPLGKLMVDQNEARKLAAHGGFEMSLESQLCDHSVEIQLPLLQKSVPHALVIPLYVGHLSESERRESARVLAHDFRPGDVLLASSDLTHYGRDFDYMPFPADTDLRRRLSDLDSTVIAAAGSIDPSVFLSTLSELESTVCGYEPIALLLETLDLLAGDDVFQRTLDYQTSAEITGDSGHSVSYASLGYFHADSFRLNTEDQTSLLASARATLRHLRETGERREIPPATSSPSLLLRASAFVSLHLDDDLFGCVGRRTPDLPLTESIPELTLAAALDDPRFPPRAAMPAGLHIEVSVLTPMKRIQDWHSFRLGRDGAWLEKSGRSGMLLPQVARHGGYNEVRFLEALSKKAGLQPDAYRDPKAMLSVFRAQVFGCPADSHSNT